MKISITKKQKRNRMVCTRDDGSYLTADLGPQLPHHDVAHFVVETALRLRQGFYGKIASGYTMAELNDKEIIKTLGTENWQAETLARALGSLRTGACTFEQFPSLVNEEMGQFPDYDIAKTPTAAAAAKMLREFDELLKRWLALRDGETLELEFSID